MYLDLFSTIKKNTYEVTSDCDDALVIETNTDIDNTSEILKYENTIEKLNKEKQTYLELIEEIIDGLSFIKKINGFLIFFLAIMP